MVLAPQLCFSADGAGKSCMSYDSKALRLKQHYKKKFEEENKVAVHLLEITLWI